MKRKIISEDTTAWMVPYGTLMMILMIFFVILYSYSRMGSQIQYEQTLANLQSATSGRVRQSSREAAAAGDIERLFEDEGLAGHASVNIDAHRVRIALTQDIIFDFGSAALKSEAGRALSRLSSALRDLPNRIIVEGHTDNIPVRDGSNWELSALRAFSVIRYMIEDEGIDPERLAAYGYGEFRPVADNGTPEGRARNRRIEISIIREDI